MQPPDVGNALRAVDPAAPAGDRRGPQL